jgi:extracellular factor (EF) 3-hydroxypalmitic acid methyl ester biosynthesis protein
MINMIMRDPLEGGSLYAKIVNLWFLQQPPAEAHRNRIRYLTRKLVDCATRAAGANRTAHIFSLGCGAAHEVQNLLRDSALADRLRFTLLDFNAETLSHAQAVLEESKKRHQRQTAIKLVKKSISQLLKEAGRGIERAAGDRYDLIYCAGLFDYLADPICRRLTNILYDWLAPGGLLITTNVDDSNPRRLTMDYLMEWHLIYRNGANFATLKPDQATPDQCSVHSDDAGMNIYLETRKPDRA